MSEKEPIHFEDLTVEEIMRQFELSRFEAERRLSIAKGTWAGDVWVIDEETGKSRPLHHGKNWKPDQDNT